MGKVIVLPGTSERMLEEAEFLRAVATCATRGSSDPDEPVGVTLVRMARAGDLEAVELLRLGGHPDWKYE